MTKTLEIKPSLDKFLERIKKIIDDPASRRRVLLRSVLELKDLLAAYPPAGAWNSAPGTRGDNRWYQRQFGTRWKRKDGTLGGINNSQRLQKSWQTEVDEFSAAAFTEVTYAPFLLDDNQRVRWAAAHGWQSLSEIEQDYTPRFEKIVSDELDDQIERI